MIKESIFLCLPISFQNIKIYPPKLKEVISNEKFGQYSKLLTLSQEEIEDDIEEARKKGQEVPEKVPTPFEFLLGNAFYNPTFKEIAEEAFTFFCHEEVNFLIEQKLILFGNMEEELINAENFNDLRLLDEEQYFDFQNILRRVLGMKEVEKPDPDEDPRIKRMKAKARYRDKIKAKEQAKKHQDASIEEIMVSICLMGIGLNPLNIGEISYASMYRILEKYQIKEKYEVDVKSILAGADAKKIKPKYWINNLE